MTGTGLTGTLSGYRDRAASSVLGRVARDIRDADLVSQAMVVGTTGMVTIFPLLIVLGSISPLGSPGGFSTRLVDRLGLDAAAAREVQRLFAMPTQVSASVTVGGIIVLVLTGTGFAASLQQAYERAWHVPSLGWRQGWRKPLWLVAYLAVALCISTVGDALSGAPDAAVLTGLAATGIGIVFFLGSGRLLLAGRVAWRDLVPGAVATTIGLGGLTGFSALFFSSTITSDAKEYGSIGVIFVLLSYFIGLGVVLSGGALVGASLAATGRERSTRPGRDGTDGRPVERASTG